MAMKGLVWHTVVGVISCQFPQDETLVCNKYNHKVVSDEYHAVVTFQIGLNSLTKVLAEHKGSPITNNVECVKVAFT